MTELDVIIVGHRCAMNHCVRNYKKTRKYYFKIILVNLEKCLEELLNQREINKFREVLNGTDKSDR